MSTARTTSTQASPTDMPTWAVPVEDLEAMLATDDDTVDTAAIPRLAFRDAVEESAATQAATPVAATTQVSSTDVSSTTAVEQAPAATAPTLEPAAPPVGHSLRRRHASPESVAAIRRNLLAVAAVIVSIVLLGSAVAWLAGWIALAVYAVLVIGVAVAVRRANARYAPRHSRYAPRHA